MHKLIPCLFLLATSAAAAPQSGEFDTSFDVVPRYAHADVIAQRTFSREAWNQAAQDSAALQGVAIDPREEKWKVHVPEACAAGEKCGVLVWVSSVSAADVPTSWLEVLDANHVIFVSAYDSGNDQDVFLRRLPLALAGLGAIANQYAIDSGRIYAGGFAGGSKVAQRLAFGFPDVFKGAILNAGLIDPDGGEIFFPPAPLDTKVRDVKFFLAVGRQDDIAWRDFNVVKERFAEHGLAKTREDVQLTQGHRQISAGQLDEALKFFGT